jgi:predicted dehydrogenase
MIETRSPRSIPRRHFLRAGALAAAPLILPSRLFGAEAPSRRLNVAIAGGGTRCRAHASMFSQIPGVRVVAVCDVWSKRATAAKRMIDKLNGDTACKAFHDYREMIAEPEVDIVTVAVPDHWHALVAIEAANHGRHIYLDKPFAYSVEEGRAVVEAVKRNGVILQHGTQQRSRSHFQRAVQLCRLGHIGRIKRVYAISPPGPVGGDPTPVAPPDGLDYEFFNGPAPTTPYVEGLSDRQGTPGWYFTSVFGGGWVTAWGSHHVDCAQWALGKDHEAPVKVEARGSYPETGAWDTAWEWYSEYEYADGGKLVYLTANRAENPGVPGNIVAVGDKGWIAASRGGFASNPAHLGRLILPKDDPEFQLVERGGDLDHFKNFIDTIRLGARQNGPMMPGHLSTTLCHLTNIAIQTQRPMRWDGSSEKFVGDPQADRLLGRAMRAPWKLTV